MASLVKTGPDLSNKGAQEAKVARPAPSGTLREASWNPRFRVGDGIRTIGGSGSYDRGVIVEVVEDEKYYRVDYGLGFLSLVREENLELRSEDDPSLDLPRSFVPPVVPRPLMFVTAAIGILNSVHARSMNSSESPGR